MERKGMICVFKHTPKIPEISGSYLLALGKDGVGGYPEVIPGFCKIDQKNRDFRKSGPAQGFKKRAAKPPRNRSETWIRLNVYGYEGTLWDRFHDLYHFGVLAAVGGRFFFDIEPESGDFLNITRAVYCISGDFGSVFSSHYDFSVLLAKSFRRLCF